mgnify:FL=1
MITLDSKFRQYPLKYVFQTLLTIISVFVILLLIDAISEAVVVASFGASTFIVFTMPNLRASSARYVLGGNTIGLLVALAVHAVDLLTKHTNIQWSDNISFAFMGSLAIGLAMFAMVITDTEHPPAAGLALGLTLDGFSVRTATITILGIIIVFSVKEFLKKYLLDLV